MEPLAPGQIDINALNEALEHTCLGGHILHFAEVASTQTLALQAARAGQRCGAWVADAQTAGRGRGGHSWHSAPGEGLYVTALFTPELSAESRRISLLAGMCAWSAMREVAGICADLRWPNDLVTRPGVHPRARKLGGVLVQSAMTAADSGDTGSGPHFVVVGIGINVTHTQFPLELADHATSLHLEGWQRPDRQALLIALLQKLESALGNRGAEDGDRRERHDTPPGVDEISTWMRGKRVHVAEDGGYTGVTEGLDQHGFLRVRMESGEVKIVRSGGVREA